MIKDLFDEKPYLSTLLFCGGYLLTNERITDLNRYPFLGHWNSVVLTDCYTIYYQEKAKVYTVQMNDLTTVLVGNAYDPFLSVYQENDILRNCIKVYKKSEKDWLTYISSLTGIYVLFIIDHETIVTVNDCSGLKSCYYGKKDKNVYFTSNVELIQDILTMRGESLAEDRFVKKLLNSRSYRHGSKYLPGDLTRFAEMKRLGPNIVLHCDAGSFEIKRFYPLADHPVLVEEEYAAVEEEIARIIAENVRLCSLKWDRPAVSLSGGVDSRTTLSAAKKAEDQGHNFYYYSFHCKEQEEKDARAAHELCDHLALSHTIYSIPENNEDMKDFADYKRIFFHNSGYVSMLADHEIRKYIYLSKLNDFEVELKSWASEIGRAFWERRYGLRFMGKLSAREFSIFQTRFLFAPILQKKNTIAYRDYLLRTGLTEPLYNYEHSDLFYWEFRFGSWGTLVTQGQEVFGFDVTVPMNNRKLMDMFLWFPHEYRRADKINKAVTSINNLSLGSYELHIKNDYLGKRRQRIERWFYFYKTFFHRIFYRK